MGSSSSKNKAGKPVRRVVQSKDHGPLPFEAVPYQGPPVQHRIIEVSVRYQPNVQFGFMAHGMGQTTTNVDDYYQTLGAQYGEGFVLLSFFKVPGSVQRQGFFSFEMAVPFQGIYCRYPTAPTQERWQLRIEKSVMYVQAMTTVRIFHGASSQSSADTSHLIQMITNCSANGGRLICVELTGQMTTQSMQMGFTSGGMASGLGVDLFFNMPLHPNPIQYTYMCVCAPIPFQMQAGFAQMNVDIHFDFMAQLAAYLNQGYRLVEIFYDLSQTMQAQGGFMTSSAMSMNSIWFFEKEASKANDNTPVYEGCIVEYYVAISASLRGSTARTNWGPLLEEMGSKGWEFACTLETPKMIRSGLASVKQTMLLFFQRKLCHVNAGTPVGLVDPATGEPMPVLSQVPPPPSYEKAAN